MTIIFKGEPCRVMSIQHLTPGKGHGMVHMRLKNLKASTIIDHRFRSDEKIERGYVRQREMEYIYSSEGSFYFMDTENFEQIALSTEQLDKNVSYLVPNIRFLVNFIDDNPVDVEAPKLVELRVVETQPNLKGATATASLKPAVLETGIVVNVPPFIEQGELIKVDTAEGRYISRA